MEQASGSTPPITGRCEPQAHLSRCSEVLVWSRFSHSLWGWDREPSHGKSSLGQERLGAAFMGKASR